MPLATPTAVERDATRGLHVNAHAPGRVQIDLQGELLQIVVFQQESRQRGHYHFLDLALQWPRAEAWVETDLRQMLHQCLAPHDRHAVAREPFATRDLRQFL